jgi:hypothetical protein
LQLETEEAMTKEEIANWLAQKGAGRNRLLWRAIYAISPVLAGMVVTFSEAMQPQNQLVWFHTQDENAGVEEVLARISEMINRAPAPMGLDGYHVFLTSLVSLPGDERGLTQDQVDETLEDRPARYMRLVQGDRWHDWKRGSGQQELRDTLEDYQPQPDAPVTLVQVAVTGAGVARTLRAFGAI